MRDDRPGTGRRPAPHQLVARGLRDRDDPARAAHRGRRGDALEERAQGRPEAAVERGEVPDHRDGRHGRERPEQERGRREHRVVAADVGQDAQWPAAVTTAHEAPREAAVRILDRPLRAAEQRRRPVAVEQRQVPQDLADVPPATRRYLRGDAGVDGDAHAPDPRSGRIVRAVRQPSRRLRVVVLRGHQANPWELRPWELLGDRFEVSYAHSGANWFDTGALELDRREVRTLRDVLPRGRAGDFLVRIPGDRYLGLAEAVQGADIVHAQELAYWYSMQAAKLRRSMGFRLALTIWETLPFADAYRNVRTRRYRRAVLDSVDLFLPTTERAAAALELEGAPADRIRVCPPGIDIDRFAPAGMPPASPPVILSAGRLVWEKGHQDLLRALALLARRHPQLVQPRALIVGSGEEEARLRRYAGELGVGDRVELRPFVPYDQMPGVYAVVLAEALAAGLPIVASTSGAIPEVAGPTATYVAPGDYVGLADVLADLPAGPHRIADPERVGRLSAAAAAQRLAEAYEALAGA
ncbi:MAG: glycosyltransferase [Actinobacteria bacterium]|nr:MAG: glycosyltransferase [Actinomycetota bacterium]